MRTRITIRDFVPSQDMEKILRFRKETARMSFPGLKFNKEGAKRAFSRHSQRHPGTIKIACSGPRQIGFIMFRPKKGFLGQFGHIDTIFVEKAHRDKGVGALLLKCAEEWFRSKGIIKIDATITNSNTPSLDFFRENGYRQTRTVVEKRF